ncbi:MAG: TorF family putative porin [Ignavibacteriales bacterium]
MSRTVLATASALACALAGPALAADGWSGNVTVASQYISKGIGKSAGDPHASLRLEHGLGPLYGGAWWGNVKTTQGADSELHLYLGRKQTLAGVGLDAQAIYKTLPGSRPGVQNGHLELRTDASKSVGPSAFRLRVEYSPDSYAAVKQAWWIEGQVSRKLSDKLSALAAIGAREQHGGADYTAWNAGVRYAATKQIAVEARWYDTDSHHLSPNHTGRFVASLVRTF